MELLWPIFSSHSVQYVQVYMQCKEIIIEKYGLRRIFVLPFLGGGSIGGHRHQGRCHRHRHPGIGIPASLISDSYRSTSIPDRSPLYWYRTGSGFGIVFHSGTGMTGCRKVRHSDIIRQVAQLGFNRSWTQNLYSSLVPLPCFEKYESR